MSDDVKAPKYPILDEIEVPEKEFANWQTTVDLLAKIADIPAALIMRVHAAELEVFVSSQSPGNVYHRGNKAPLTHELYGLYCEKVMDTRRELLVPNALQDPSWDKNPDIALGMIAYCGLPLTWPDGRLFGTICVLDKQENHYSRGTRELLERFRDSVQFSLEKIYNASVERKQAQEALLNAHDFIQQLISSANVMIVGLDPAGRLKVFNPAAEKITGYTLEELTDIPWFGKIVPRERYPYVWETFRKYQQHTGALPATFENPILTKSGEERFICWQNEVISAPGAEISTISFGLDITERKKAEELLIKAKEEWERTFDSIEDPLMILDARHRIIKANKAMADKLGVTQSAAEGLTCYTHVHGTAEPPYFCPHALLLADGKSHSVEIQEELLGGYYNVSVSPLYGPDGKLSGSVHIARDISARKQAEDELRESEQQLREILARMPDIVMIHKDGIIIYANQAAVDATGYSMAELIGSPVLGYVVPEDRDLVIRNMTRRTAGEDVGDYEVSMQQKSGSIRTCIVRANKTVFAGDEAILFILIDITDRKLAEDELAKYRKHLEELVQERTTELLEKNAELERFNKLFVGRELRMVELKERIRELERQVPERPGAGE